jgi:hypothetical protein
LRDLGGFRAGGPAGLTEIFSVGVKADLAINVLAVIAVSVVVEIDFRGH